MSQPRRWCCRRTDMSSSTGSSPSATARFGWTSSRAWPMTLWATCEKMRFLKRVEPSDVSDEWAVIGLVGPAG